MKFFFILSLGRSGTNFLAKLLNKDSNAVVYHEPCKDDYHYLPLAYYNPRNIILKKLLEQRFSNLISQIPDNVEIYGEVNSLLRYHVDWLKERFNPVLIHIVRDGRDFVKSAYTRSLYTGKDSHLPIIPLNDEAIAEQWSYFSRFQKLCWYWAHTNEFLLQKIERIVKFEDILKDYDYFCEHIFKPTGVKVSVELYNKMIKKPTNSQREQLFRTFLKGFLYPRRKINVGSLPHWKKWDSKMTKQFWDICGETMNKFNYSQ